MEPVTRRHDVVDYINKHRFWYFTLGALLVVGGMLAIIYSYFSTAVSIYYVGSVIAFNGIVEAAHSFRIQRWAGFLLHLAIGIIFTLLGVFIIMNPTENILVITLVIGLLFILAGIFRLLFSFSLEVPHWWWIALSGLLSIVVGAMIWRQWPTSALWVLGTLVGADMLVSGVSWIMVALSSDHSTHGGHHGVPRNGGRPQNQYPHQKKNSH